MEKLKTVKKECKIEFEEKKSKFIGYVKPVFSKEEAEDYVKYIKSIHSDATHNCSAYKINNNGLEFFKVDDDGEPSGTAGVPMLGVLENHQLTNVCAVVTRYFGGIKLGAGGLIRAYSSNVALAIKEIGIVHIKEQLGLRIALSYSQYQELPNFLKANHLQEQDTSFTEQVQTTIFVDKDDKDSIIEELIELFNGKIDITDQGLRKVEVPISLS